MAEYLERAEKLQLPVIPLAGVVAFPTVPIHFELNDAASVAAASAASATDSFVFLICLRAPVEEPYRTEHFFPVGTVAKIKQTVREKDGTMRVLCDGYARAELKALRRFADYWSADVLCKTVTRTGGDGLIDEALLREAKKSLSTMMECIPALSPDLKKDVLQLNDPGAFSDFVAAHIFVRLADKQEILEQFEPVARLERTATLIGEETELLLCEMAIHKEVRERMARNQKEFYLREQMHVIEEELGEGDGEIDEYEQRIREADLPPEVEKKLLKENDRMAKTPFGSAEASVLRGYLDVCLELPWGKKTKDRRDYPTAEKILDADHEGLKQVKERISEFLAVKKRTSELRNQVLCLVGPPGVGKTSVAQSIARALNRRFVRVSLGGVRDEADIRGHRKTYLGAMPGRIINAITQAGYSNPLILLDEIDKLTRDAHGDPSSALLEVLDSEQNKTFRDHFVELPFDLSECIFIATANTLDTVPRPLIDRMEVIELHSYTRSEKLAIAENHLLGKQLKRHGLNRRMLKLSKDTLLAIIDDYTHEAGVRNLERRIADICRKAAKRIEFEKLGSVTVTAEQLPDYLGTRKRIRETVGTRDRVGVVNGLAYTELGGDLLQVEAITLPGEGKIELTGSLGDVMKESARIAVSYIRAHAEEYGIPSDFFKTHDLHIHFPEGAVPKDGPSAGAAMVTALVSAVTGTAVRHEIAMTGEITLTGEVLAIGGLREKTMAAAAAGATTVLIPADNQRDLPDLDPEAVKALQLIPCRTLADVLAAALVETPAKNASELPRKETLPGLSAPDTRSESREGDTYGI